LWVWTIAHAKDTYAVFKCTVALSIFVGMGVELSDLDKGPNKRGVQNFVLHNLPMHRFQITDLDSGAQVDLLAAFRFPA